MEIVDKPSKLVKVIRLPFDEFIQHARGFTGLTSEHFQLNGLSSKFYLWVFPSAPSNGYLLYYLCVADMGIEKEIELTCRFWLENVNGEKCAKTEGMPF
jgi:hypothetical protein